MMDMERSLKVTEPRYEIESADSSGVCDSPAVSRPALHNGRPPGHVPPPTISLADSYRRTEH